jgi:transcriptional regulator with XRE-family HTH domain
MLPDWKIAEQQFYRDLGRNVARARERHGLSQYNLADIAGVSCWEIDWLERADIFESQDKRVDAPTLERIAHALGLENQLALYPCSASPAGGYSSWTPPMSST